MAFIDRLKDARKNAGMTQEKLAQRIGVAKSTYTGYEKGNSEPNMYVLSKIMEALNVDANYLYQDEVKAMHDTRASPHEMEHLVKKYRLLDPYGKEAVDGVLDVEWRRVLEKLDAEQDRRQAEVVTLPQPYAQVAAAEGAGAFLMDSEYEEIALELNDYTQKADVILKVVGRSMEPEIHDGDRILVREQPSVNVGEIGVFILDGQGYLKVWASDRLVSLNPEIKDVYPGDLQQVECFGKFIKVLDPDWIR